MTTIQTPTTGDKVRIRVGGYADTLATVQRVYFSDMHLRLVVYTDSGMTLSGFRVDQVEIISSNRN